MHGLPVPGDVDAARDPDPVVRLHVASALQRMPEPARLKVAAPMLDRTHPEDDRNLQLLIWYGIEPLASDDRLPIGKVPLVRQHRARRVASSSPSFISWLRRSLSLDAETQSDVLQGIQAAIEGRRNMPMPREWPQVYAQLSQSTNEDVRQRAIGLALVFGDPQAFRSLRASLADPQAPVAKRQAALGALVQQRDKEIVPLLKKLIDEENLRGAALRALAAYDDDDDSFVEDEQY